MLGTKRDLSTFPALTLHPSLADCGELPLAKLVVVKSDPLQEIIQLCKKKEIKTNIFKPGICNIIHTQRHHKHTLSMSYRGGDVGLVRWTQVHLSNLNRSCRSPMRGRLGHWAGRGRVSGPPKKPHVKQIHARVRVRQQKRNCSTAVLLDIKYK